jgi:hypothetical protein
MNITQLQSLQRTLLLMRDNLRPEVSDLQLVTALTGTTVALIGDAQNLASHAAQSAYVTAATLAARSGHHVYLAAPDLPLTGAQPPLKGTFLVSGLLEIGKDLIPGVEFSVGVPPHEVDLSVSFGNSGLSVPARRILGVNATAWSAQLRSVRDSEPWLEKDWPCGALAAGALVAAEAFKATMQSLRPFANNEMLFDELFAYTNKLSVELAPTKATKCSILSNFDLISAGAITNAALYVLARLPGVSGAGRVIEPESTDASNLNRYVLLLQSEVGEDKARLLERLSVPQLDLCGIKMRYDGGLIVGAEKLHPNVLVGVDDIAARWKVQEAAPVWLGIGATSHWCAMASFHHSQVACARCLHPRDEAANGPIPTVAFVSFFAGLQLACYFIRAAGGELVPVSEQHAYMSPLQAERIWRTPVDPRVGCPTCPPSVRRRAA